MAPGTLLTSKLSILAIATTVCLAVAVISQRFKHFGFIFRVTKTALTPPYIYLLFNFILFCILSSSFWSTTFKSLLKSIHNCLSIFNRSSPSPTLNRAATSPEQAFISYFTRQTSSMFENFHWNIGQKETAAAPGFSQLHHHWVADDGDDLKQQLQQEKELREEVVPQEMVNSSGLDYNRTVPFDGELKRNEDDGSSWFSPVILQQRDAVHVHDDGDMSSSFNRDQYMEQGRLRGCSTGTFAQGLKFRRPHNYTLFLYL